MDWFVELSTWAESNSGQIQILIALVALVYAYKAYKKVLEQIKVSNDQTQISIKNQEAMDNQAKVNIKLSFLEFALAIQDKSNSLDSVVKDIRDFYEKLPEAEVDDDLSERDKLMGNLENYLNGFVGYSEEINSMIKRINNKWDYDYVDSRGDLDRLTLIRSELNKQLHKSMLLKKVIDQNIVSD